MDFFDSPDSKQPSKIIKRDLDYIKEHGAANFEQCWKELLKILSLEESMGTKDINTLITESSKVPEGLYGQLHNPVYQAKDMSQKTSSSGAVRVQVSMALLQIAISILISLLPIYF